MKDIVISIPDNEYGFFMKLIKNLDFVTIKEPEEQTPSKEEFLNGLKEAVEEVKEMKAGKKKGQTLEEFLNEL